MNRIDDNFFNDLMELFADIYTIHGKKALFTLLRNHDDVRNNVVAYLVMKEAKNEKHL